MLGRRNVRIKVIQTLYSWEMDREMSTGMLEKQLESRMEQSASLYVTDMLYLVEVCRYSAVHKAKGEAKYIKTEEDKKASATIAANRIIVFLEQDKQFNALVKKTGVQNHISSDVVRSLFSELSSRSKYKEYAALQAPGLDQDKEIIQLILKKVFPSNRDLENHLEELFITYHDDNPLLLHVMGKYVEAFDPEGKNAFFQGLDLWEDESKFGKELLAKTVEHNDELLELIKPRLKNWDMERVAMLDLIMLKAAICELQFFPTIPVKATMNEYIEISKLYSTPKSKDFVNGVLDTVKNELVAKGGIKKFGRGLME